MTTEGEAAAPEAASTAPAPAEPAAEQAPNALATILQRLQEVPITIRKYLLSDELAALHQKIFDEHGLTPDDRDLIYYTELQTFFGDIPLADFPDRAWIRLEWDDAQEEKAAAVIIDVLGYVFLPAQAFLGDVAGLIAEFGGDLKKYPEKQLELRRVTYMEGAREIAESVAIADLPEDMRKRLAHIIESRLRQVRDDGDTKEMLMKAKKTGGMELSEADANGVLSLLASKMRMTKFVEAMDEGKAADLPVDAAGQPAAPGKELAAIDIKRIYGGTDEEQEALKKRMERFSQVTENDAAKMRDAFYQVLFPPDLRPTDPLYVVAGLVVMAGGDSFSDAVENDERYRAVLHDYLKDKVGEDELAAYDAAPTEPRYMNMLLQLLLRGIAGYDEAESARFGLRYLNALKKQGYDRYADLVAFDMEKGAFRWKENVEL